MDDYLEFCREINKESLDDKKVVVQKAVEMLGARKYTRLGIDVTKGPKGLVWFRKLVKSGDDKIMLSARVLARSQSEEL